MGCIVISFWFLLSQYRVIAELKLAVPESGAPSLPATQFIGNFNSNLCIFGSIYIISFLSYYFFDRSSYLTRLILDEISVIFCLVCIVVLLSLIITGLRIGVVITINVGFFLARICCVGYFYFRDLQRQEIYGGFHMMNKD